MFNIFLRFLRDRTVEKYYIAVGRVFGNAVSYIYMGECVGFETLLASWEKWETEYSRRGYRTLPLDDFVEYGGYGIPLKNVGKKRSRCEEGISHAKIYREEHLGKIPPAINISNMMGGGEEQGSPKSHTTIGTYFLPSTKKIH
jgi:hypothetical protein